MLSERVKAWRDGGEFLDVGGRPIFVRADGAGDGPPIVVVHGYPSSSFDWANVIPLLAERRPTLTFDLLGYGLSAKPIDASYSLFEQADLVEAVVAARGVSEAVLVGHDMGDTVLAELLARHNAGRLGFGVERVFLTNGSIFIDLAQLSRGQRTGLKLGGRAAPVNLPGWWVRRSLRESIAPGTAVSEDALDDMVALIARDGGARLLTKQIRYIVERRENQPAWTAALVDFSGPLTAIWGERDPIAIPAMPRRLAEVRPATEVVLWDDAGHWPSVEVPERLAGAIVERL